MLDSNRGMRRLQSSKAAASAAVQSSIIAGAFLALHYLEGAGL
jgi:hypothetical protein